ncbi:HPr family phosphocarrier protein [Streptomyces coerulescens]|uniref:HPr family phosphocarrier protein n=1 Tax=Streptomyces coerulescens TaxID=29304 RepID=A0ABW0CKP7_STRCD
MSASSESPSGCRVSVVLPEDLHARPAGRIATAAARFTGVVRIEHEGRSASATSVLALMALGARAGSSVHLVAEGPDATEATEALSEILTTTP